MALTKTRDAIAQLTASGTSTALDVSGADSATLYIRHSNGTGTVTAPASFAVQAKTQGGTNWYTWRTVVASTTAAQIDDIPVTIDENAASVRVVYTAPAGPTGFTCDAEIAASARS